MSIPKIVGIENGIRHRRRRTSRCVGRGRARLPIDCSRFEGPSTDGFEERQSLRVGERRYAAWLKLGTMQIFLKMLEDRALGESLRLSDPISAVRRMSREPGCTVKVRLENGTEQTAVEIQTAFLDSAKNYFKAYSGEESGPKDSMKT